MSYCEQEWNRRDKLKNEVEGEYLLPYVALQRNKINWRQFNG